MKDISDWIFLGRVKEVIAKRFVSHRTYFCLIVLAILTVLWGYGLPTTDFL